MKAFVERVEAWPLNEALNQPFTIATGSHASVLNVFVRVTLADGTLGYGECAPAPHITGETQAGALKAVKALAPLVEGAPAGLGPALWRELEAAAPDYACARAGLEMALLDASLKRLKVPLWKWIGADGAGVRTDVTLPLLELAQAPVEAAKYQADGIRVLKIKIGRDVEEDLLRVLAVSQAAPRCGLILDANQGYDEREAAWLWKELAKRGVKPSLFEQPVPRPDWDGLKGLTRRGIPVCADESVKTLAEARKLAKARAAGTINIKLMKSGLWQALEIASCARAAGLGLMVGGMVESALAMGCAAQLAAAWQAEAVDLDTPLFFKRKATAGLGPGLDGVYRLRSAGAGIGVRPLREPRRRR